MKRIIIIGLLAGVLSSCGELKKTPKAKIIKKERVLIDKIKTVSDSYTGFLLAFNDGYTKETTFGYYSCLQIGDTVLFVKNEGEADYWYKMKPDCK